MKRFGLTATAGLGLLTAIVAVAARDGLEDARRRVAAMPVAERAKLKQSWEKFNGLFGYEQRELREAAAELERCDPAERKSLDETMDRCLRWLDALPPDQRKDFDAAPDSEARLRILRDLVAREQADLAGSLKKLDDYVAPAPTPPATSTEPPRKEKAGPVRGQAAVEMTKFLEQRPALSAGLKLKLNDFDKGVLESLENSADSVPNYDLMILTSALASYYHVPEDPHFSVALGALYNNLRKKNVSFLRAAHEGAFSELTKEEKLRFYRAIIDLYSLPPLSELEVQGKKWEVSGPRAGTWLVRCIGRLHGYQAERASVPSKHKAAVDRLLGTSSGKARATTPGTGRSKAQ